jgi:hypothetical protein
MAWIFFFHFLTIPLGALLAIVWMIGLTVLYDRYVKEKATRQDPKKTQQQPLENL